MSNKKKPSPPRVKPQPASRIGRSERTRAEILNSALDFIWSHPFRDLTVNSLMAPTSVSRSAFYQHFGDLHEVMEALLDMLREEIFNGTGLWFTGVGDPITLLNESLASLVDITYQRGPILRATDDAAATDTQLEKVWIQFFKQFDDAVTARIEADQEQGLIPQFDASPVAIALNRLNAYTIIQAFGHGPARKPEPVCEALARVWISTLYGSEWVEKGSSDLLRT